MLKFCFLHSKLHTNQKWRWHLLSMCSHGEHKFVTVPAFLYSTLDRVVLSLTNRPLYPQSKNRPVCRIAASEDHKGRLETFEKRFFALIVYHTKTARLSGQYRSRHTDWAVGNNTNEYASRLSRVNYFLKLQGRNLLLLIACIGLYW